MGERGPLADRDWRVIREEARGGAVQMALDEIAAETAAAGGPRTVRLYQWEPSCLSMSYNQRPESVDWEYCERAGIEVTRRQTGGGGIYHDQTGDISYSIIAPADDLPGELLESYHLLCEPILAALASLGVEADYVADERAGLHRPACYLRALHPAHDVVTGDGRKIAGNAQYRQRDAVIQHGSLTYSTRPEPHLACFDGCGVSTAAFADRVAGIDECADVSRSAAVETVTETLAAWADAEPGGWTDAELEQARQLAEQKYADDDWVRADPQNRA